MMGITLHMIAGTLATTQPEAAAIIRGAAEAYVAELPILAPFDLIVTETLGDERARELRARGADMDWDQAIAYPRSDHPSPQRTQSGTQP